MIGLCGRFGERTNERCRNILPRLGLFSCIRLPSANSLRRTAPLLVLTLLLSLRAFAQGDGADVTQRASELLTKLLSRDASDEQWSEAQNEFEGLPPSITLPVLFPEVAKGIPGG